MLSLLQIFNALTLKDAGSHKVAGDVPFGNRSRHRLDVYAPRQFGGPLPVVFFIYGGAWSEGRRENYEFVGRAIAALGYLAVIADYRLLPEVEYPVFLEDCLLATNWVASNIAGYGGNPTQIALMGHSAGAYNAVMLALHPDYISASGKLGNVRCVVGLSGPYDFFPFDGKIAVRTFGGVRNPEDTQPIAHVTGTAPPMFLGTGDKDRLVYPRNTAALAKQLRKMGVAVEETYYSGLGHPQTLIALSRAGRRIAPVLDDVAAFLALHLA